MNDYRKSLKSVGIALAIVGAVSLNVLVVIAGILLCRGSLKTAQVVGFLSAFLLCGTIGIVLVSPFMVPPGLLWTYLRLHPWSAGAGLAIGVGLLGFLAWTYRILTTPAVLAAMDEAQIERKRLSRRPAAGFIAGALLVVILVAWSGLMLKGATAKQARTEARKKVGEGYTLFVSSLSMDSSFDDKTVVHAVVIAYNPHEIREVEVTWER